MSGAVLLTGGAGFIGSHIAVALLQYGARVIVYDNFSNSCKSSLDRVAQISGCELECIEGDVRDAAKLRRVFVDNDINRVIHCAGLKAVGESVKNPLDYYSNNVGGTLTLLAAMQEADVYDLVFSSSATVYGAAQTMPLSEDSLVQMPSNPYGCTKFVAEKVLHEIASTNQSWRIAIARYFNPVGAHESGMLGEDPQGTPNNLVPFISQVAVGKLEQLSVFGHDYPTVDGTGVRDYIHVMDLAFGHIKAMDFMRTCTGCKVWNFGTGKGYSVLELISAFEDASGVSIPYKLVDRRPGDVAECWADISMAAKELGWQPERNLRDMMLDTWRWQSLNPNGYR
ncbi:MULTISPECIES: UDP-glucose 4-epimerase GalE [unclassified Pseudomonas]|uniref:UDP-glucose 4-epimerase GalE n=1 Tax=unclassified Pseudomonas TaxID=196821 RepID=UPI0021BA90F9|nr:MULTISPECIES: UDP-glucose 4-epimerase GalE [unclassified Pseudomonas]MCT8166647.1 UDP-glucose 4-epimerase GalE [Pseudomonas sp. HD6422]MCT8185543.1 UDP-glucose 4-epimerase GalE [Pseudomonas sp. HD6421]